MKPSTPFAELLQNKITFLSLLQRKFKPNDDGDYDVYSRIERERERGLVTQNSGLHA